MPRRVFLLSPARAGGPRYQMLMREGAAFDTAVRLRQGTAQIGEIYSFISGLYFRGKLAYASAFGGQGEGSPNTLVIVPGLGLLPPDRRVSARELEDIASIAVDEGNAVYRGALVRDAAEIDRGVGQACEYVLLGSVASTKYTNPLLEVFGQRLLFPTEFIGRGDMSRGGLMLRAAQSGVELPYAPVLGSPKRGQRPPKLEPIRRPKP